MDNKVYVLKEDQACDCEGVIILSIWKTLEEVRQHLKKQRNYEYRFLYIEEFELNGK